MRSIRARLFHNWKAKLVTLALATVIWLLVRAHLDHSGPLRPSYLRRPAETSRTHGL